MLYYNMNRKIEIIHTNRYILGGISMNKGRKNMYDMMVREVRNSNKNRENFFLRTQLHEKESVKIAITQEIVNTLGNDIEKLTDVMTKAILEDLLNGRR